MEEEHGRLAGVPHLALRNLALTVRPLHVPHIHLLPARQEFVCVCIRLTVYPLHVPHFHLLPARQAFVHNQPVHNFLSFLSRTLDLFSFFLSLWIYLWLAETSQQPISQTTWLKVTPHCNHCNHCRRVWWAHGHMGAHEPVWAYG
jgi:hypothetical protein